MTYLLIAVLVVLIVSHYSPDLVRLRRYDWFPGYLARLGARLGEATWQRPATLLVVLALPLVAVAVLQSLLSQPANGVFGLVFATVILFLAWGPRDLDRDIEAVAAAAPAEQPVEAVMKLQAPLPVTGAGFAAAAGRAGLRRWFGPLFWFVLLGAFGAALYRLAQLAAEEDLEMLPPEQRGAALRLLAILDWPVVHLMALAMAVATDFDTVVRAWRARTHLAGGPFVLDEQLLPAVTVAAIKADLEAEAGDAAVEGFDDPAAIDRGPLLRDSQAVAWRVLIVWLAVIGLIALASLLG
jgi:AmpE protein